MVVCLISFGATFTSAIHENPSIIIIIIEHLWLLAPLQLRHLKRGGRRQERVEKILLALPEEDCGGRRTNVRIFSLDFAACATKKER